MHGWYLVVLILGVFWIGFYAALFVRALIEDAAQRRLGRETMKAAESQRTASQFPRPTMQEIGRPPGA